MTNKQIKEGNRLITQFMDWELIQTKDELKAWVFKHKETGNAILLDDRNPYDKKFWNKDSVLEFDKSWNDLMTVVVKIEEMDYGIKMCRKVVEVYVDSTKEVILKTKELSRFESLFKAVVEFINWYNANKK